MKSSIIVLILVLISNIGCSQYRQRDVIGGYQPISSPKVLVDNLTKQFLLNSFHSSSTVSNDIINLVFWRRYVRGQVQVDCSTYKPELGQDMANYGVHYTVIINVSRRASSNDVQYAQNVIEKAFDLSKRTF